MIDRTLKVGTYLILKIPKSAKLYDHSVKDRRYNTHDLNLWSKRINEAPTIKELVRNKKLNSRWEISNGIAINHIFKDNSLTILEPKDKVIYENNSLLVVADLPDERFSNLNICFYHKNSDSPFLKFSLDENFEIISELRTKSTEEVIDILNDHSQDPFINNVIKTLELLKAKS